MGVDEWLMVCKKVKALSDQFPADWEASCSEDDSSGTSYVAYLCSATLSACLSVCRSVRLCTSMQQQAT